MIHTLSGTLKHYFWGGTEFIADLLGQKPTGEPVAEYWLGAHIASAAQLEGGIMLDDYLRKHGLELPYLLKILDVNSMLSIQVHPSEAVARQGYEAEQAKKIPINKQIYKDANAKPEMCVALSEFYLLSGFRHIKDSLAQLSPYPSLAVLAEILQNEGYRALHNHLHKVNDEDYQNMLKPLIANLQNQEKNGELREHNPAYWLLQAYKKYPQDRALLLILVLNLIYLREGQAYFHREGILHAYLRGQCVEIMGNSDNVLRAGLTEKPVHLKQLMTCTNYEPMDFYTCPLQEKNAYESSFVANTKVFNLQKIDLPTQVFYTTQSMGVEILLFIEGSGHIEDLSEKRTLPVERGQALLLLPNTSFALRSQRKLTLFRASSAISIA